MSVTIYNQQTGESKVVSDSSVRWWVTSGLWQTTPPEPTLGGAGTFDPNTYGQEKEETAPLNTRRLSSSDIQGLYADGKITYQQAYGMLVDLGYSTIDAGLLLSGGGPADTVPSWLSTVAANLLDILGRGATEAGFADPKSFATSFLDFYWDDVQNIIANSRLPDTDPSDPKLIQAAIEAGWKFLQKKWGYGDLPMNTSSTTSGGGGGPTVAQSYDLNQLADRANAIWRTFTLSDAPNPLSLAKQFVAQVAGNPMQALDFNTWVKTRVLQTADAKFIFRNKPAGIPEDEYLRFYADSVFGVLGPGNDSPTVARNQAALASTPDALTGRLRLHPTVTKSSGYLNRLEEKYRSIRDVLG